MNNIIPTILNTNVGIKLKTFNIAGCITYDNNIPNIPNKLQK